jgi:uncharacterized protein (DUF58 family)
LHDNAVSADPTRAMLDHSKMSFTASPLSLRIADWIGGRRRPEHGPVLLDRKRVYILPTRPGMVFAAAMLVLLVGSINYGLQLGYMLTFTVVAMALVGMHHTHRNLARIVLRGQSAENVFAGDVVSFEITLTNPTAEPRYALQLSLLLPLRRRTDEQAGHGAPAVWADVPANGLQTARIGLPTRRRGHHACPRLRIETRFPFGLFQAWAYFQPALSAVVFPAPEADPPPLPATRGGNASGSGVVSSGDDFAGVRPYQLGDPLKRVAWRLVARSEELSVKLFDAPGGGELLFDFDLLPGALDAEGRLSRLTAWVLAADAAQVRYGLRLPGKDLPLGHGPDHRERCLVALALHRL